MISQTNQVLDLWFNQQGDAKNYKLRIANPKPNLKPDEVKAATLGIVRSHALDFNGSGAEVSVKKAHFVTTDRQVMIKN